jgi:hypothetical protein
MMICALSSGVASRGMADPLPSVPFVVSCRLSHLANDDPILHRGVHGASHRHAFYGNRVTSAASEAPWMRSAASTCASPLDRSAYWIPAPSKSRAPDRVSAYYDRGTAGPDAVRAWPEGLQMVTARVEWSCGSSALSGAWPSGVPRRCEGGRGASVRMTFPSCWDGRSTAWPGAAVHATATGSCPASHPVPIARLRLIATFTSTPTAVSSGDLGSMHADVWSFWEPGAMEDLVAICVQGRRSASAELRRCGLTGSRS